MRRILGLIRSLCIYVGAFIIVVLVFIFVIPQALYFEWKESKDGIHNST